MDVPLFPTRTQEPYADLLKKDEWFAKKAHIIARDNDMCCNCGRTGKDVPLEVHHSYYVQGCDPWEYPDEVLVTLCSDCHRSWHQDNQIRYAEKHDNTWYWVIKKPCQRCGGVGYLRQYHYYHDGICFKCWGERFEGVGQRIQLFTEQLGKTPQEYFDVFAPLTDEEFVRIFRERGHSVSYLAMAQISVEGDHVLVLLCANTGLIYDAFLDGSMLSLIDKNSSRIRCLNVKTLLFKECMNKNHKKYIIVKGEAISYSEARKMADEIRDVHKSKTTI